MPSPLQLDPSATRSGPFPCVVDAKNVIKRCSGNARCLALNGSGDEVPPDPTGKRLEKIVPNLEVRGILQCVMNHVRVRSTGIVLPYRYDEPGERRFCEMTIASRGSGELEFSSHCRSSHSRKSPPHRGGKTAAGTDSYASAASATAAN